MEKPPAPRHMIFLDCHTGEYPGYKCFAQFDPRQIVDQCVRAGADAMAFFSKDHFGNCFCDLPGGHKHKDIRGDFTGAVVAEAKRRGLGVWVYYSVFADRREGMKHPDWEVHNPEYTKTVREGFPWRTICHNSLFTDEVFIPHVTTVVERYRPVGLCLDTMNFAGVCTCTGCRAAWKKEYGSAMNVHELKADGRKWATFFHKTWNRAMRRAYDACAAIDPKIQLAFGMRRDNPDLAREVESICPSDGMETNLAYVNTEMGILTPGLSARILRARSPRSSVMVNAFNGCWGEATVKNATLLQAECAAATANGIGFQMAEYTRSWGKVEPEAMKVIGKAFAAEDAFEEVVAAAGFLAPRHIAVLDNNTFPASACVTGAGKLLVEAHQQFNIIDETGLDDLEGYKVLWAPPVDLWQDGRWAKVLAWVRRGGVLMLEASEQLSRSRGLKAILKAAGVRMAGASKLSAIYLLPAGVHRDERHGEMAIMVHEPSWRLAAAPARRVIDVADPIAQWDPLKGIVFRMNVLHPDFDTRRPGVVEGSVGKGSVIVLPAAFSRAYWQHNYSPLRRMIVRLISQRAAAPFEVDAPPYVEANLLTAPQTAVLHLVQYCLNHSGGNDPTMWCGDRYHDIEDVRPIFNLPVRIARSRKPRAATVYPEKKKIPFTFKAGVVHLTLPRLDLHAAIRIDD